MLLRVNSEKAPILIEWGRRPDFQFLNSDPSFVEPDRFLEPSSCWIAGEGETEEGRMGLDFYRRLAHGIKNESPVRKIKTKMREKRTKV